jgi:hypothetical protein
MVDLKILCGSAADMFVVVDGVRIARRGYPGTSQAGFGFHLSPAGKSLTTGAGTQSPSNTTASASITMSEADLLPYLSQKQVSDAG